ncbi:MAG: hypothetical protein JOY91_00560 [Sinobacteraceae bacterium]|nr:hypothetical protein [Nevskiaceae bacterium]
MSPFLLAADARQHTIGRSTFFARLRRNWSLSVRCLDGAAQMVERLPEDVTGERTAGAITSGRYRVYAGTVLCRRGENENKAALYHPMAPLAAASYRMDYNSKVMPGALGGQQGQSLNPLWLFLAAVVVDVTAAFLIRSHTTLAMLDADESEYWNIASQLQVHGLSGIPARRTLPFPLLLASLRALVGDNYFYVQLLVSALLAITPVLAFWLVQRHTGNQRAALLTGVAFLLWPPYVYYGASIYSDSIALMLFLVYLLAFPTSRAADKLGVANIVRASAAPATVAAHRLLDSAGPKAAPPWRRWLQFVLAGALLGLCVQTKPLYLLYTPIALCLAIASEPSIKRGWTGAVLLAIGCTVVSAPWSGYLSAREGRFILISANGGETLAGGLNPTLIKMDTSRVFVTAGKRSTWGGPGKWVPMDQTGYVAQKELELPYAQVSALMWVRAREWIRAHPSDVAYLSARKLLYMWGIYPLWNGMSQSLLGNIPLLCLIFAACWGLWAMRRAWRPLALFWTLPILSSLVALVSWGSWRFRMPADAGLIILAVIAGVLYTDRWMMTMGKRAPV